MESLAIIGVGTIILITVLSVFSAEAADSGLKDPTTTGSPNNGWTNPTNAYASDDSRTNSGFSNVLQDYATFSFGVPAGATIDGISEGLKIQ